MTYSPYFDSKKSLKLFGLIDNFNLIKNLYITKKLPKVLMLTGKKGSGKSTLINHLMFYIFDQKNYQIAVVDLSKVPLHSPDYIEAQRYIDRSNYYILVGRFQQSSEIDRFILIHELVNISNKIGESKFLLDSLDMIKTGIDTSSSNKQTKDLINLLGSVVALNKKPEVHQKALNYLLTDFGQFYDQTEIRPKVLQIIGTLKMEHM